jgi:hypothetical protein
MEGACVLSLASPCLVGAWPLFRSWSQHKIGFLPRFAAALPPSLSIPSSCVHRWSGEQIFKTLVLVILHRERMNSLSIPSSCVHRWSGEQIFKTLVLVILHQERMNKLFGKRSSRDCSQLPRRVVFHASQVTLHPGIFIVNCSELFLLHSLSTLYHHQQQHLHHQYRCLPLQTKGTPRDPMSSFILFNLTGMWAMLILPLFMLFKTSMRAMLILVFVFMLFNLTSMRAMFVLVYEIVMI